MEPKLPAPHRGPEFGPPVSSYSPERQAPVASPERAAETRPEHLEQRGETPPVETAQTILPPPVVAPQPPTPVADEVTQQAAPTTPLVANDDDLIEKEWVDKAKQIVIETKDDPYKREAEVVKLQVEYLRKRYGKELGASD